MLLLLLCFHELLFIKIFFCYVTFVTSHVLMYFRLLMFIDIVFIADLTDSDMYPPIETELKDMSSEDDIKEEPPEEEDEEKIREGEDDEEEGEIIVKKEIEDKVEEKIKESGSEEKSESDSDVVILSSHSEDEEELIEDSTSSGAHINDAFNVADAQGRVLVNVGHPEGDEDIFLAPQLARLVKPHQVCPCPILLTFS